MIPAQGCVKNYHWGKLGDDNYIAKFQEVASGISPNTATIKSKTTSTNGISTNSTNGNVKKLHPEQPLAELWFGTHPSGPATLSVDNQRIRLDKFLAKEPEMVGGIEHYHKYNKKLPFLFKVLSVAQPLSLQAHPDKKLAQALHQKDPKNYPDSNHKPELAIALTEFEVLCDFRPAKEIAHFMKNLAPFRRIVGDKNFEQFLKSFNQNESTETQQNTLKDCFKSLMLTNKETITKETKNLLSNSESSTTITTIGKDLFDLIRDLDILYPGDPGVLTPFFLNHLKLNPGQAVYLRANKLHAYIKGECIECMACSDNVVRAGLTTKYRDVDTLIKMLDYQTVKDKHDVLLSPMTKVVKINNCHDSNNQLVINTFAPTEEFKVDRITISKNGTPNESYTIPRLSSGSFIIVLSGSATVEDFFNVSVKHKLSLGSSGFIPPGVSLKLYDIGDNLTVYRAYC